MKFIVRDRIGSKTKAERGAFCAAMHAGKRSAAGKHGDILQTSLGNPRRRSERARV
jgi:hypothetical protein